MQSKADLMHFSMELSKKLDIWYKNPPVPVDLSIVSGSLNDARLAEEGKDVMRSASGGVANVPDLTDLQNQFRPQLDWQR